VSCFSHFLPVKSTRFFTVAQGKALEATMKKHLLMFLPIVALYYLNQQCFAMGASCPKLEGTYVNSEESIKMRFREVQGLQPKYQLETWLRYGEVGSFEEVLVGTETYIPDGALRLHDLKDPLSCLAMRVICENHTLIIQTRRMYLLDPSISGSTSQNPIQNSAEFKKFSKEFKHPDPSEKEKVRIHRLSILKTGDLYLEEGYRVKRSTMFTESMVLLRQP
jgi:hypothetical protein